MKIFAKVCKSMPNKFKCKAAQDDVIFQMLLSRWLFFGFIPNTPTQSSRKNLHYLNVIINWLTLKNYSIPPPKRKKAFTNLEANIFVYIEHFHYIVLQMWFHKMFHFLCKPAPKKFALSEVLMPIGWCQLIPACA